MASAAAVQAGRKARRRRHALAVTGALAVVALLTAGLDGPRLSSGPVPADGPPGAPGPVEAKSPWPVDENGVPQEDATARSGPRAAQARKVLAGIQAVLPSGYSIPDGGDLNSAEAVVGDNGSSVYQAHSALSKDGGTGRLLVEVHTKGNGLPATPCVLAQRFWEMKGACEVVAVGADQVGVVTEPAGDDRLDQWAAFRYPDGTVVFVAQSRTASNSDSDRAPLAVSPLSVGELAALAVAPRFRLD